VLGAGFPLLVDQKCEPDLFLFDRQCVRAQAVALRLRFRAHDDQGFEIGRQSLGLDPDFRQNRAEHDRGADRRQRILRPYDDRWRRAAPDAL